jgi:hypothetical protein
MIDINELRRLLELAAKAVGFIDDATDESVANGLHRGSDDVFYITSSYGRRDWSPTEDDGDALRLAVSLNLSVKHGVDIWDDTQKMSAYAYFGDFGECFFEEHGSDPYAASRLAIVRAAAAIGEKMESKQ